MKKRLIAALTSAVVAFGTVGVNAASMMIDTTNSTSKLVALKEDGTVKVNGYNLFDNSQVAALSGVKQVACEDFSENSFFVLLENGTVRRISKFQRSEFADVESWTGVTYIDGANNLLFGLTEAGTVLVSGNNASQYAQVGLWKDIVSIYAKEDTVIAIDAAGDIQIASLRVNDVEVKTWKNMKKVVYDIRCFWGITNDGQIVTTDSKFKPSSMKYGAELLGDFVDIECMSGYASSGYYSRVLALKKDGTLIDINNHTTKYGDYLAEVMCEDVAHVVTGASNYVIVKKSGEIISDKMSVEGADWILGVDVRYNGKFLNYDVPPYIKEGRTMIPVRALGEALGADISYDDATKTAKIARDGSVIEITMNSATAYVNGTAYTLDAPAENVQGRIFVPVRFVSEGFGLSVQWEPTTKSVLIK